MYGIWEEMVGIRAQDSTKGVYKGYTGNGFLGPSWG